MLSQIVAKAMVWLYSCWLLVGGRCLLWPVVLLVHRIFGGSAKKKIVVFLLVLLICCYLPTRPRGNSCGASSSHRSQGRWLLLLARSQWALPISIGSSSGRYRLPDQWAQPQPPQLCNQTTTTTRTTTTTAATTTTTTIPPPQPQQQLTNSALRGSPTRCACHEICTSRSRFTKCCPCHETCTSRFTVPATKSALRGLQVLYLPRNLHFDVHPVL